MRLYNDVEETSKVIVVEDYSTFKGLLKCKYLYYLLIAYTAYAVINAALSFIEGSYLMAIINILVHGSICASLWVFRKANAENNDEKLNLKGSKLYLIAHAIKYLIVFIFLVLGLIFIIFSWTEAGNVAKQELVKAQSQTSSEAIALAKAARAKVFWSYLGYVVLYIAFTVFTLVYYKAVMAPVDALAKYNEKGTHFWNELKFLAIILFVTAFLNVVLGLFGALGILDKLCEMMINNGVNTVSMATGGLGWFAFISRVLFAAICVCLGLLLLKGYKVLETTETSHEEVVELEEETTAPNEVDDEQSPEQPEDVVDEVVEQVQ